MFCKSDVVDPWYSGDFDKAYNDIEKGCNALLNFLLFEILDFDYKS